MTWKRLEECKKEQTPVKHWSKEGQIGYVNAVGRLFSYVYYPILGEAGTLGNLILLDNRKIQEEKK